MYVTTYPAVLSVAYLETEVVAGMSAPVQQDTVLLYIELCDDDVVLRPESRVSTHAHVTFPAFRCRAPFQ